MLKVAIVDDEIPALKRFKKLFKNEKKFEVVGAYSQPKDILEQMKETENGVDVVFLDIEMPEIDGLSLAQQILDIDETVDIVFVTAYDKYALEAFEINALDYILKPISQKRFEITLSRIVDKRTTVEVKRTILKVLSLGKFRIIDDNGEDLNLEWRTSKTKELFAYLLHHYGQFMDSDKIIFDLWENDIIKKSSSILHTTVYYLRKMFNNIGYSDLIESKKGSYRLNMEKIKLDFVEFERLTKEEFDFENIKYIERILELYDGEYFANEDYVWALGQRVELKNSFINIVMKAAKYYQRETRYSIAEKLLKRLIVEDPLCEEAHEQLISIFELSGDRIAARRQYEYLWQILKDEFDIEPKKKYDFKK